MELEFVADPETVPGISRLKGLIACREGRPRTAPVKIVWHDSPQHALLASGLTLAEQRGVRRLERVVPGGETWLPAQPVPVVGEAPEMPPLSVAPIVAFEGRQGISLHQFDGQPVTVTVAKGMLRAVTETRPAARLWLSGEEQAVRAAAMLIAEGSSIAVPLVSLAADGIALATGQGCSARHQGPPALPATALNVADAFGHILGHLIDVILANAPVAATMDHRAPEAVHQMRVAVRRARSAVSVFRPALPEGVLDAVNDRLKGLGERLGPTRDWDVFVAETAPAIGEAMPDEARLDRLIAAAERRRLACLKALAAYLSGADFQRLGIELAWFVAARFWHAPVVVPDQAPSPPPDLPAFAASVLRHRWKKLVALGKRIEELDIPALHGVRLRAKRARYAAEMFSTLYPGKPSQRFVRRLGVLQQRLGVLNDGAVASHLLAELGGASGRHAYASGIVIGFLAARAARTRPRIVDAFERFRRQPAYWD